MEHEAPQIGVVIGGRFRVTRLLGKGGMGVVVAARNLVTGKQVAIKWMHASAAAHADSVQRLIQEAAASARIRHPNVVDVYDIIQDDTGVFLVMEYLNGEPLTRMLERGGMPVSELISVLIGAMRGVSAAHKAGVVHRDIKPDNIFLIRGADGQPCFPKVLDFGISKITDNVGPHLTQTGTALGTPMYMSCEQLRNARDVDGRTDIYAFGVILYEAVTGQSPFPGESFAEVVAKIMTTEPPTPKSLSEHLPDALDEVIRKAMAKDRETRFPTLDDCIQVLEPFATPPTFQLQISDEDDQALPPADPSMVTALTPVARSAFAHASTVDQIGVEPLPPRPQHFTPISLRSAHPARKDHSGMVRSSLQVPPPARVNPHLPRADEANSIRPADRTLDPRTTARRHAGERPRHIGTIGLLVAVAVAVGAGAMLLPPTPEDTQKAHTVTTAGIRRVNQPMPAMAATKASPHQPLPKGDPAPTETAENDSGTQAADNADGFRDSRPAQAHGAPGKVPAGVAAQSKPDKLPPEAVPPASPRAEDKPDQRQASAQRSTHRARVREVFPVPVGLPSMPPAPPPPDPQDLEPPSAPEDTDNPDSNEVPTDQETPATPGSQITEAAPEEPPAGTSDDTSPEPGVDEPEPPEAPTAKPVDGDEEEPPASSKPWPGRGPGLGPEDFDF